MRQRPLVIGNWKMNLDFVEALHLVQQIGVMLKNHPLEHTDIVVAPPFVDLRSVTSVVEADRLGIAIGAQHVNSNDSGAHTGEISTAMLKRLNVEWVIVGHSERRTHYAMSDDIVAETLRAVVRAGQHAVLCVGESTSLREAGEQKLFVESQLSSALTGLESQFRSLVTVAYEPLWAIGTGVTASTEQVHEMTSFIRGHLSSLSFEAPKCSMEARSIPTTPSRWSERATSTDFSSGAPHLRPSRSTPFLRRATTATL